MSRLNKVVATILASCFFIALTITTYSLFYRPNGVKQWVRIEPKWGANQVVDCLYQKRIVNFPTLISLLLRLIGKTESLQAGVYSISPDETVWQIIDKISRGNVARATFTIIAGMTLEQTVDKLNASTLFSNQTINLLPIKNHHSSAEGLFLAETYQYLGGSDKQQLLLRANQQLEQVLLQNWQQRQANMPYQSAYELLIAASIIEKETSLPQERGLIASVIVNRLKKNMRLQMDPTVIYGLGDQYTGKLYAKDLLIKSAYNTYRHKGLPPTPIAMVSQESIKAAANPTPTNYYYFVATGDRRHRFSSTYAEHQLAVKQYRSLLSRN